MPHASKIEYYAAKQGRRSGRFYWIVGLDIALWAILGGILFAATR